jgi:hypothetical protein
MANKERKPEDVKNYIDIYDTLRKAVPDGANVLAVMRAAEFLLADCIASADVTDEVREQTYAAIPDDIRNFVRAFKTKND